MFDYDLVGVPLIYTQLATFATYSYFVIVLIGRAQFLDPSKDYDGNILDFYFPLFSTIEFIVFMGWLQVALKMLDPYGLATDDVNFDLHWVLHRNVEVGNAIVSRRKFHPKLRTTVPLTGIGSEHRTSVITTTAGAAGVAAAAAQIPERRFYHNESLSVNTSFANKTQ